jgi:IclR family acetate operon transcriptional repressor
MTSRLEVAESVSSEPRLPAVDRAINLLEVLAVSNEGLTISGVSHRLGIPFSSAHYLVYTLMSRGYIQRTGGRHHYILGPRAFDYTTLTYGEWQLRRVVSPYVQRLGREVQLVALAAVQRGREGIMIENWAYAGKRGGGWHGCHFHMHSSALGKALLAYLPDAELNLLFYDDTLLLRFTARTITSLDALKAHLADVRDHGYAVNNEEDGIGWKTVAAPVFDHIQNVTASIGVSGPRDEVPDWRVPRLAERVISTATDVSRSLSL